MGVGVVGVVGVGVVGVEVLFGACILKNPPLAVL